MKILIVDDEPDIRMLLALSLAAVGASIIEAKDGIEAVSMARRELPDIIVLDAIMPYMSGPEAVPLLREASPLSAIYLFSAIGSTQLNEYGENLGVEVYPKTRIPDLVERIESIAQTA